jgi:SAM-dependent methyltransferase
VPDARYDGHSAWYDEVVSGYAPAFARLLAAPAAEVADPGDLVLDVGCGTGLSFDALRGRGLQPAGVDVSADQLRVARERDPNIMRGDAAVLPVRDAAVRVAVAAFIHTDVDDFSSTVAEVGRVLRHGGRFVYVGTHPCFVGPFVRRDAEHGHRELIVRPGYGDTGVSFDAGRPSGLSARVGFRSQPLAAFLSVFFRAGLRIESLEELDTQGRPWVAGPDDGTIVPWNIRVVATKP